MSVVLLDDHLLLRVLLDDRPSDLGGDTPLATTGLWYHRLCRALADDAMVGSMSRRLGGVAPDTARAVVASVVELPATVQLVSLRDLAWPMAELIRDGARLNLLSLEAVAAARHLDADICLAAVDRNEPLCSAAERLGIAVHFVDD